jgi:hypothetical protein
MCFHCLSGDKGSEKGRHRHVSDMVASPSGFVKYLLDTFVQWSIVFICIGLHRLAAFLLFPLESLVYPMSLGICLLLRVM